MRQVHIHTDLKWSSKEQSGLEMPRLGPGWPGHTLRGLQWPHVAPTGLSRGIWAIQRPVGASQGHSVSLRTTSGQYEYILVSFRNPVLFCKYLNPLKSHKIGSLLKFTYGSQFSEICSLVPEILNKQAQYLCCAEKGDILGKND